MTWRYQPVYVDHGAERVYSLCEVYFDDAGRLDAWTESPAMTPQGCDPEDLQGTLERMLSDAQRWEPVSFEEMRVGMMFAASRSKRTNP